jgi:hypothetical protein
MRVIQQGAWHAWHNERDDLAILVALVHRPDGIHGKDACRSRHQRLETRTVRVAGVLA